MDALATFTIKSENWLKYKTYISQCMLEKGFLVNVIYSSTKHTQKYLINILNP